MSLYRIEDEEVEFCGLRYGLYTLTVAFGDLGSGASSAEALTGFPTNVFRGPVWVVPTTAFAGEADLAVRVGDTGDDDGAMASQTLHAIAAGDIIAGSGVQAAWTYEADWAGDGADATFTATELDDVSAGACVIHVKYARPQLVN